MCRQCTHRFARREALHKRHPALGAEGYAAQQRLRVDRPHPCALTIRRDLAQARSALDGSCGGALLRTRRDGERSH